MKIRVGDDVPIILTVDGELHEFMGIVDSIKGRLVTVTFDVETV